MALRRCDGAIRQRVVTEPDVLDLDLYDLRIAFDRLAYAAWICEVRSPCRDR